MNKTVMSTLSKTKKRNFFILIFLIKKLEKTLSSKRRIREKTTISSTHKNLLNKLITRHPALFFIH